MPVTRRLEIIKWAKENNVLIIEDDYNGELRYSTHPMPCVQNYDTENTVYLGSFSKILLPSVRISYMVLPPHLAATYQEKLDFYACTVSNFEQYALAAFIEEGYFEKHLNRMRLYYTKQREAVLSVLKEEPFKCVGRVREADSGLHFILELNTLLSDNEVKRKLEADGIHINALSEYYHNNTDEYSHSFVISYSDMKIENFRIACSKMSELTPL